jgi:geranylgeranyl diphosphate synthase type II
MHDKYSLEERCRKILEDNGGVVADKARTILLEDPALKDLRSPLEFISKNWRDLTPALMRLSCEAVGGRSHETDDAAVAVCLMNLSFYIWDDIIDNSRFRSFKPTLFGKFGEGAALIIGGLASAKAFSILNEMPMDRERRQIIDKLVWELWAKMAQGETATFRSQSKDNFSLRKKFWKIKTQAADLEACLKIGAIIGGGSVTEINHLGKYGLYLGIVLELCKDFRISINLTAELAEKIKNGTLPYSTLWVSQRSQSIQKKLDALAGETAIKQKYIKEIVEDTLATGALNCTAKNITMYAEKGKGELVYLNKNNATQTLKSFIGFQPRLFMESLSIFQAQES